MTPRPVRDTLVGVRALAPLLLLLLFVPVALAACASLEDQVRGASTTSCIEKTCRKEPDAPGYKQCEATCRSTYGR